MSHATPVRIGVVGLGFGSRVHVPAFRRDDRCRVVALAGRDADRTRTMAIALAIDRSYSNWMELLADDEVDAVSIAVPPSEQPAIISEAARQRKHVFCEKPVASSVCDAEQALECVRRAGIVHAMNFIFPEIEAWQSARQLLQEGAIGAPMHFSYRWYMGGPEPQPRRDSWKSRAADGGGAVGNFLPHVIFNIESLLGEVAGIHGVGRGIGDAADAFCDCVITLVDGVHGRVSISTDACLGCGHEVEIFGDSGTMVLRNAMPAHHADGFELGVGTPASGKLEVVRRDPVEYAVDGRIAPSRRIVSRFLDALRDGCSVTPNLTDGLRVQRWVQQVQEVGAA